MLSYSLDNYPKQYAAINWDLLAGLRFFLASIVVFSHVLWFENGAFANTITELGAKSAVVGFLLISGFSIAASIDRDERHFYFRRFKRIYPLYLFAVLAAFALQGWLGRYHVPHHTFERNGLIAAVGNLILVQTFVVKTVFFNPVLWSLAVEVSFYVVSPFIRRLPLYLFAAIIVVSATFYLLPHHNDWGIAYTYALKANAIKYFWPFAIGFALYSNRATGFFVLAAILGTALVWASKDINYESFAPVTFTLTIFVIFAACQRHLPRSRALSYLGDISYPLYIVQIPVLVTCYATLGITNGFVLFAAAVVMSVVAYELIDVRLKPLLFRQSSVASDIAKAA